MNKYVSFRYFLFLLAWWERFVLLPPETLKFKLKSTELINLSLSFIVFATQSTTQAGYSRWAWQITECFLSLPTTAETTPHRCINQDIHVKQGPWATSSLPHNMHNMYISARLNVVITLVWVINDNQHYFSFLWHKTSSLEMSHWRPADREEFLFLYSWFVLDLSFWRMFGITNERWS